MKPASREVAADAEGSSEPVSWELDPVMRWILSGLRLLPPLERFPLRLSRGLFELGSFFGSPWLSPRDVEASTSVVPSGGPKVRIWQPRSWRPERPGILFIHGGGWVYGSCFSHRTFCALLARSTGYKVYSVEYRRAPEHPFPAPLLDVHAAWNWLVDLQRAQPELHAEGLMVGGDSAGGNLAAVLCHRLRDLGGVIPAAQFLIYPVVDAGQEYESVRRYGRGFLLTSSHMRWLFEQYQGTGSPENAQLSPIAARTFRGLPPAFVALAGRDILVDQGLRYADKLAAAGVPVQVQVFGDMIHGFINMLVSRGARRATREIIEHVRRLGAAIRAHR